MNNNTNIVNNKEIINDTIVDIDINYKIYIIEEDGQICYVGKTRESLNERFAKHAFPNQPSRLTAAIVNKGRQHFCIKLIQDNLTYDQALILEKKYIRKYNRLYMLYNKILYSDPKEYTGPIKISRLNEQQIRQLPEAIECINTHEVFESIYHAGYKYNINIQYLKQSLANINVSAGYDYDDNPLFWKYINKSIPNKSSKVTTYQIYVISQLINNIWIPIYVGSTSLSLNIRLAHHRIKGTLSTVLQNIPKDQIKIEAVYTNILTKKEKNNLEAEYTLQLQKKYPLLNKYIASYLTEEYKKHKRQLIYNKVESNFTTNSILCVETEQTFLSVKEAVKKLNITERILTAIVKSKHRMYNNQHFQYIETINSIINSYYSIYYINIGDKYQFIYTKYNILAGINKIINSYKLIDQYFIKNIEQISIKLIANNILDITNIDNKIQQYEIVYKLLISSKHKQALNSKDIYTYILSINKKVTSSFLVLVEYDNIPIDLYIIKSIKHLNNMKARIDSTQYTYLQSDINNFDINNIKYKILYTDFYITDKNLYKVLISIIYTKNYFYLSDRHFTNTRYRKNNININNELLNNNTIIIYYLYSIQINNKIYYVIHINNELSITDIDNLLNPEFNTIKYNKIDNVVQLYSSNNFKIIIEIKQNLININNNQPVYMNLIQCINTQQIFINPAEICTIYDFNLSDLKKHLQGKLLYIKDKNNQSYQFQYINKINIAKYKLYYILYNNIPKIVVISTKSDKYILNLYTRRKAINIWPIIQSLNIKNLSIQLVIDNIETKKQALQLKKEHINKLLAQKYDLLSTHI